MEHTEIAIVGGGLAGSVLALALAQKTSYSICLIEAKAPLTLSKQHALDTRTLALNYFSQQLLTELGLWHELQNFVCPIHSVHISERGAFNQAVLNAEDVAYPNLGCVVEIQALHEIMKEALANEERIQILQPATVMAIQKKPEHWQLQLQSNDCTELSCDILCAADSSDSPIRQWLNIPVEAHDYQQSALVVTAQLAIDHQHIAYERFLKKGVLALLPLNDKRAGIVWVQNTQATARTMQMRDEELLTALQSEFGYRAGRFLALGKRQSYPLKMLIAKTFVKDNAVLLGNAAHTLNPIGAQGLNLSLRDIATLVNTLTEGLSLDRYASERLADVERLKNITHQTARIFDHEFYGIKIARRLGLGLLDKCGPLRRFFTKRMMGF